MKDLYGKIDDLVIEGTEVFDDRPLDEAAISGVVVVTSLVLALLQFQWNYVAARNSKIIRKKLDNDGKDKLKSLIEKEVRRSMPKNEYEAFEAAVGEYVTLDEGVNLIEAFEMLTEAQRASVIGQLWGTFKEFLKFVEAIITGVVKGLFKASGNLFQELTGLPPTPKSAADVTAALVGGIGTGLGKLLGAINPWKKRKKAEESSRMNYSNGNLRSMADALNRFTRES